MNKLKKTAIAVAAIGIGLGASQAYALETGDQMVRFGPASVMPNDDSGEVKPIPNTGVEVDDGTSLAFTYTYMFRDNVGFTVLGALPFEHDIEGTKDLKGVDIATIEHLPPTFVAEYHFKPNADTRPYVGAGINYTTFMDESADSELEDLVGKTSIDLDDSWGLAVMGGVDMDINESWFFNASLWYIDIETDATLDTANAGRLKVNVDIDPWVVMLGVGTRF